MRAYVFQATGALLGAILLVIGILRSTNSTASIGFIFIPVAILLGAFAGDTLRYILDLVRRRRTHSMTKTLGIALVLVFCGFKFVGAVTHSRNMAEASSSQTSAETLLALLQSTDQEVVRAAAANPSLPVDAIVKKAEDSLLDYYVMSGIVENPQTPQDVLENVAWLERSDFKDDTEYDVYQTYVFASLARRPGLPEALIQKLCEKKNPSPFLTSALAEKNCAKP